MANEQQYYNPIIQSMVAAQQQQMQRAKLQQEAEQFKADKGIREHQLQLAERKAEIEAEHQKGVLDIQKALADVQIKAGRLAQLKQARDLSLGGTNIKEALGTEAPAGIPDTETLRNMEIENIKRQAGAQAGGQAEALEPFKIRDEERLLMNKQQLMQWENEFTERMTDKKIASEEFQAKLSRETQRAIANAANATHMKIANMQYTPTPEAMRGMFLAGATGAAKLNYANPQERAALGTLREMGGREVDPKEASALREGQQLVPLFDRLEKFADRLPNSKIQAFAQGKALELGKESNWPSDIQNELNNILSQALVVGRAVEGLTGGRVLSKQLELDLNSITSGGITKKQALERLENLRNLYINKQENMVMGGMPNWQRDLIKKTYGLKDVTKDGPEEYVRDANGKLVRK